MSKQQGIEEAQTEGKSGHFATLMELCHLKNSELDNKLQNYQTRVVLRGDAIKDYSGSYALFTEERSIAKHMSAAKVLVTSRLPGWAGEATDAVSSRMMLRKTIEIIRIWMSNLWDTSICSRCRKSWENIPDPIVPSERHFYGHHQQDYCGNQTNKLKTFVPFEERCEEVSGWQSLHLHLDRGLFQSVYVDDIKMAGKKQNSKLLKSAKWT